MKWQVQDLPGDKVPLRSSAGIADVLLIQASDRLHNPCARGGEHVTADIVPDDGRGANGEHGFDAGPLGVGGASASDVRVGVRDVGDGTYEVRWHGERRGLYRLSVRLRGAHVGASPVALRMLSGRWATTAVRELARIIA